MRYSIYFVVLILLMSLAATSGKAQSQNKHDLKVSGSETTITVLDGDKPVFVYNKTAPPLPPGIKKVYARDGMIHPVFTPAGQTITGLYPADHAHQSGIFAAWVRTKYDGRKADFWNVAAGQGRVVHDKVISIFADDTKVGFEIELLHRIVPEPQVDVLRERWKLTVFPQVDGNYCFDLETKQNAITDKSLLVEQYRYGGVAIRGLDRWVLAKPKKSSKNENAGSAGTEAIPLEKAQDTSLESNWMLNDRGEDRISGNHKPTKWIALGGLVDAKPVNIAVLSHPSNFGSPQPARLHPNKPYFCFAPCVAKSFEINKEQPYTARYRYFVSDSKPDSKWLDQKWEEFAKSK